jgi:hypothetical protein
MVVAQLHRNAGTARRIIAHVIPRMPVTPDWPCHAALKNAIMTDKKLWPAKIRRQLAPLLAKYL